MANPEQAEVIEDQREQLMKKIEDMQRSSAGNEFKPFDDENLKKNLGAVGSVGSVRGRITLDNCREAFTYIPWTEGQVAAGKQVTEALIAAAETVLRVVPESPLRTRAINGLFDARMIANAAITHGGKF